MSQVPRNIQEKAKHDHQVFGFFGTPRNPLDGIQRFRCVDFARAGPFFEPIIVGCCLGIIVSGDGSS